MRKQKIKNLDSVAQRHSEFGTKRDMALLHNCQTLWENLRYFREDRARALRFVYGDQWGDLIKVNGKTMTQRSYLTSKGNIALQSNQIQNIVRTITGVWVKEQNEPVCHSRDVKEQQYGELMTTTLQTNWQLNEMKLILIDSLINLLVGGLCIARESYEERNGTVDTWTDQRSPNYIFFDSGMKDSRFGDMTLIGEIHDISFKEFCKKFCKSPQDYEKAREWYTSESSILLTPLVQDVTRKQEEDLSDFYTPSDNTKCRVFEIWTKEIRPMYRVHDPEKGELFTIKADDAKAVAIINAENISREQLGLQAGWEKSEIPLLKTQFYVQEYWYCRMMTPQGYIIREYESPYSDRMHPYSICAIPFIDGKIMSYINDAIDHNIAINRALTIDDWMKRTGAKGVSFIPKNLIPDDMTPDEFADQWTSVDGIIFYQPKANTPEPRQFYGNVGNLNTVGMVQMLHDLLENSVSMSGAIQGKTPYSGTSAALYAQQTQNASTPIASLMARFENFFKNVAERKLKTILQYYDVHRYEQIAGKLDDTVLYTINLNNTNHVEYDLSVTPSTETPVYRMVANDMLLEFWRQGAIKLRDALELSSFPFKDKLIQKIDAQEVQQQEMQQLMPSDDTAIPQISN